MPSICRSLHVCCKQAVQHSWKQIFGIFKRWSYVGELCQMSICAAAPLLSSSLTACMSFPIAAPLTEAIRNRACAAGMW